MEIVYRQLQTEFRLCVLLHNGNKFSYVPIGHFVIAKEHYINVEMVLEKLRYFDHMGHMRRPGHVLQLGHMRRL